MTHTTNMNAAPTYRLRGTAIGKAPNGDLTLIISVAGADQPGDDAEITDLVIGMPAVDMLAMVGAQLIEAAKRAGSTLDVSNVMPSARTAPKAI